MAKLKGWSIADSLELYRLPGWSGGYFGINAKGHVTAHPSRNSPISIDIKELVEDAQARGLGLPLLIRFSDILADRIDHLRHCFDQAIAHKNYQGDCVNVFPVKVNPQRQVIDEIVRFGAGRPIGLEAGSKPELHLVLAMLEKPDQIIICNGYKDPDYIRLALQAQKLGKTVFLVAEKRQELERILRISAEEGLRPHIGVRVRLSRSGAGKWEDSGGDHSKFGLTAWELVEAVDMLREAGRLDCFRLLHVHLGSQITDIRKIREALREMTRYFAELRRLGCNIDHVDVGGGLAVDYNGSRSTSGFSMNYDVQEYAHDVVGALADTCARENLPHPRIITEAGRALAAHHAMIACNVLETGSLAPGPRLSAESHEDAEPLTRLQQIHSSLNARNLAQCWRDAQNLRGEALNRFESGDFTLEQRARADRLYWAIAARVKQLLDMAGHEPEELERLEMQLADRYFCNFSVFQSLPDSWAIGQEFPVMPLHRLNEKPARHGILQDITCDSDGKIDRFISAPGTPGTVPLHAVQPGEPYLLGIFLTGAYQEILGDMHNLFGDTNVIHVAFNDDGSWRYEEIIHGENIADVLAAVQYNADTLVDRVSRQIREHVSAGDMSPADGRNFLSLYERGLRGTTFPVPLPGRKESEKISGRPLAG